MTNYAAKSDLKSTTDIDTSQFAKNVDLASLNVDIDKLETTPVDLSKLSDVLKTEVIKKDVFDELVKKSMLFRLTMPGTS